MHHEASTMGKSNRKLEHIMTRLWGVLVMLDLMLKRVLWHLMAPLLLVLAFLSWVDGDQYNERASALTKTAPAIAYGVVDYVDYEGKSEPRRWLVDYTFTDLNGRMVKGRQKSLPDRKWTVGTHTVVSYHPTNSIVNAIDIGSLAPVGKSMRRFALLMFAFGGLLGLLQVWSYWRRHASGSAIAEAISPIELSH
jgi:hypothetical protein